jgi:hypothetical protein
MGEKREVDEQGYDDRAQRRDGDLTREKLEGRNQRDIAQPDQVKDGSS